MESEPAYNRSNFRIRKIPYLRIVLQTKKIIENWVDVFQLRDNLFTKIITQIGCEYKIDWKESPCLFKSDGSAMVIIANKLIFCCKVLIVTLTPNILFHLQ